MIHDREPQDGNLPPVANFLLSHYLSKGESIPFHLRLPEIPRSLNSQYGQSKFGATYLVKEVREFRDRVKRAVEISGQTNWKADGSVAVIIVVSTSKWVREDRTISESDVDNRPKLVLDALQDAVPGFRDEAVWDLHAFKQLTKGPDRTTIYLFGLGPLVSRTQGL